MLPTRPHTLRSVALTAGALYVSAWGLYYLAQETIRKTHLRNRKRRYPLKAPLLPPQALVRGARVACRVGVFSTPSPSASHKGKERASSDDAQDAQQSSQALSASAPETGAESWYGNATPHERHAIAKRFASLKVLGRWANVTPEWREQGAWEWALWKGIYSLFYKPRIWWDGGFSRDAKSQEGRERIERLLPVSRVDTQRLWGTQPGAGRQLTSLEPSNQVSPPSTVSTAAEAQAAAPESGITFTWLGQSTCLIQLHGLTVLTDPVFGVQPIASILSPTRMRPLPCTFTELVESGRIDVILLTHNHFDHLDVDILPLVPTDVRWIVPLGLTTLLVQHGIRKDRITELDWWQTSEAEFDVPVRPENSTTTTSTAAAAAVASPATPATRTTTTRTLSVTAVPASHWSARTPLDTNTTLWNSYSVDVAAPSRSRDRRPSARLFFCGDTGYSPSLFTAIGRALGPYDLAALPIGSYEPRWHMSIQHMHVVESVQVVKDIGARRAFGMHWGTWQMSDERWDDPPRELEAELKRRNEPDETLRCIGLGQTVDVPTRMRAEESGSDPA